jgi:penicillin-binding protein 1A
MSRLRRFASTFGIAAAFLVAAVAGTAAGVVFAFVGDLPLISALDDYAPGVITRVVARDGSLVGEFATERREVVQYDQIPEVLRLAIIAAEDQDFMTHGGFHPLLMMRAAVEDVVSSRRTPGRSTITQQLARQVFPETLGFERAWVRKIKEALVALQIEKRYAKEEILTMYCNKVAWGYRTYGVEAASQLYFGKRAKDVTLDEAATLAGLLPAPQRLNPYANLEAAQRRKTYTLQRMAAEGFITEAEANAAIKKPIVTRGQPTQPPSLAPYLMDTIRPPLEEKYGSKSLYEDGLVIKTGIDPTLQRAANRALDAHLRRIDKLRGFRRPARNLIDEKRSVDTYRHPRWTRDPVAGDILPAIVTRVGAGEISVRLARFTGTIARDGYQWTGKRPADLVREGDVVEVAIVKLDTAAAEFTAKLDQAPQLEGAVVALENRTGQVLAMVGGASFERSQFNRSTQAMRQVGSLFKPFVFTAAIDRGYTAQSILDDSPASFPAGPNQPPYEPKNYDREFHGPVTIRESLQQSRNIPTIRLMAALGPKDVIQYTRKLGITAPIPEYLSVAIGAAESTLIEMTSAYSAFPNQGVRMQPILFNEVVSQDGTVLEQHRAEPHEALRADTAYIMTNLFEGVVQHGTAASAAALKWPLGGKTGTTDDYTDAWFIGFDPEITVGVWVGFDQKRTIGNNQTGTAAALPIWRDIMQAWIAERRKALPEPPTFERPGNIVTVNTPRGPESFIVGTEPGARTEGEGPAR